MRRKINAKQAVAVGYCLAVIFGATGAVRSDAPLQVFVETVLVGLVAVPLGVASVLAIRRLRAQRLDAEAPAMHVMRALAVGLIVGVLIQAVVSVGSSLPLFTFISNVAFVLWVGLLVAFGILAIERRNGATVRR